MKVYILYKEIMQDDFVCDGVVAQPTTVTIGVYKTKEKAEIVKANVERDDERLVRQYGCDPCSFYIDDREVQ